MSEEVEVAEVSESVSEVSEAVETKEFPMEDALDDISADLFGKKSADDVEDDVVAEKDEIPEKTENKTAVKDDKEAEATETTDAKETALEAPNSWKKEMKAKFTELPEEAKAYIVQREEEMAKGLEMDRGDANLGRTMRDVMTPYEAMLQERGIEAPVAVQNLLKSHYTLSNGSPEQKRALLQQLAKSYGITRPKKTGNPQVDGLAQKVSQLEYEKQQREMALKASHERSLQENRSRIEAEVSTFAESHPHFDELSGDIAIFINGGLSLEDAYDKALKANDDIKESEIQKRVEAELEKAKKEAEEAKKAKSVNVRSRNSKSSPTAPLGTMEDTMRETFRKLNSGN